MSGGVFRVLGYMKGSLGWNQGEVKAANDGIYIVEIMFGFVKVSFSALTGVI